MVCRKALGRNVPLEQATALAAGAWNGLSPEKRAPYDHMSAVERIKYEQAVVDCGNKPPQKQVSFAASFNVLPLDPSPPAVAAGCCDRNPSLHHPSHQTVAVAAIKHRLGAWELLYWAL